MQETLAIVVYFGEGVDETLKGWHHRKTNDKETRVQYSNVSLWLLIYLNMINDYTYLLRGQMFLLQKHHSHFQCF